MNKEELVKMAFEGEIECAENENKIIISLNDFDEDIKEFLNDKHKDDEEFDNLESELNSMLIDMFEKNGYDVYKEGGIYAEDGTFKNVNPYTAVALKRD